MSDVVVIGVGNRMMGDDAAGPVVIDRLAQRVPPSVELVESVGDATHLLETWRDAGLAVVVDAVISDGAAGSVKRVDGIGGFPSAWRSASTHLVGLAEAIDLGDAVGVLPETLVIYGIEIDRVQPAVALSPAIDHAVDEVVDSILDLCEGYVA